MKTKNCKFHADMIFKTSIMIDFILEHPELRDAMVEDFRGKCGANSERFYHHWYGMLWEHHHKFRKRLGMEPFHAPDHKEDMEDTWKNLDIT